jgi:hypothetical protein
VLLSPPFFFFLTPTLDLPFFFFVLSDFRGGGNRLDHHVCPGSRRRSCAAIIIAPVILPGMSISDTCDKPEASEEHGFSESA